MVKKTLSWWDKFKLFVEPRHVVIRNIIITFFQVTVSVWVGSGFATDQVALSAAVGAGLSAVWNVYLKPAGIKHGYLKG